MNVKTTVKWATTAPMSELTALQEGLELVRLVRVGLESVPVDKPAKKRTRGKGKKGLPSVATTPEL